MDEATRDAVVQQLLDDRDQTILDRIELRKQLVVLLNKDHQLNQKLLDIRAAGRLFGHGLAIPTDPKDYDDAEKIFAVMAKLRGDRPWEPGNSRVPKHAPPADAREPIDETPVGKLRIADRILEFLQGAAALGSKAAPIRDFLKQQGINTHEKTVGMTLYRLSQEGLVRRDGRIWFFIPEDQRMKNPGGSAPGSIRSEKVELKGG
jgi:hypothetical protein